MKVLIVGAGIAGLTLALELHKVGIQSKIYESVKELRPLGVGINLLPHAMRNLADIGVSQRMFDAGIETQELAYYNKQGQRIGGEPRGRFAGYDVPQVSIHRGKMQMILLDEVRRRLGDLSVISGHRLSTLRQDGPGRVVASFVDPETGEVVGEDSSDVVVGADGINSSVRKLFYPNEGPANWNGEIFWRGTTVGPSFLTGASMILAGGARHRFMAYPISREPPDNGEERVNNNWTGCVVVDPREGFRSEDWNRAGKTEHFLHHFRDWNFGWIDIPGMIEGAEAVYEFPCVDRDPIDQWTFGRVTLMGDAAHAMYPMGSNGASQSILDATCLAAELTTNSDIDAALASYEGKRRPATAEIVMANRRGGPSIVLAIAEERAPDGFKDGLSAIPPSEFEAISTRYKSLAGFDHSSVNRKTN